MTTMRPADERKAISAGKLASPSSTALRENVGIALRIAVAAAGSSLVVPSVRPRAIHRVLGAIAPTLDPASREAEAVLFVLARTTRALGIFLQRNPKPLQEQISATEKQSPVQ